MANKLKITKTNSVSGQLVDAYISQTVIDGAHIGGTGGLTSITGYQLEPQVYVTGGSQTFGSILAQKGAHKFRVTDGTNVGDCKLVNSGTLTAGQMNLQINLSTIIANITPATSVAAGGATSTYVTWTTGNVTGPVATPRVGDIIIGFSGNAANATVTAVNGSANVTIGLTGNVTWANNTSVTDSCYASRITNKFVYDFSTDGNQIAGQNGIAPTYYTSGNNPDKFRYRLAAPDATFVQVMSA
jgi:hypothetical protein